MKRVVMRRVRARKIRVPLTKSQPSGSGQSGLKLINSERLNQFNPAILDLGDTSSPSQEVPAIAAVFDLSGFTRFSNQVDAHLVIPKFLTNFLDWFFSRIRIGLTGESRGDRKALWAELPMLVKFMGDGVMLVWDSHLMTDDQICKIVATCYDICYAYRKSFYPRISVSVDKPPLVLRCGVARGKAFSIGDGKDFVGNCINTASRLANLNPLSFCFHHRGINVEGHMREEYRRIFTKKQASVRGLGDEPIWLVKEQLERLPEKSRRLFRDPVTAAPPPMAMPDSRGLRVNQVKVQAAP